MEDEYEVYRKYGISFPNAGRVPNAPLLRRYFKEYKKQTIASEILHMKQFDKAFKLPEPPELYTNHDPYDKYNSFYDREGNHPWAPPV